MCRLKLLLFLKELLVVRVYLFTLAFNGTPLFLELMLQRLKLFQAN